MNGSSDNGQLNGMTIIEGQDVIDTMQDDHMSLVTAGTQIEYIAESLALTEDRFCHDCAQKLWRDVMLKMASNIIYAETGVMAAWVKKEVNRVWEAVDGMELQIPNCIESMKDGVTTEQLEACIVSLQDAVAFIEGEGTNKNGSNGA